ncbi:Glycosyltransferase RgtA/B/C/D-like domain-containing protein [Bordetella sputigena]|uniref:glycosyltransferase family 39 protein n=1 Tax=Bordetella sputigena TaxID=1416810 RepID=UPI0039F0E4CA
MAEILFPTYTPGGRSYTDSDTGTARLSALLVIHLIVWTTASWLYRANLDWAGDMLENYSWGIAWQPGYYKHPPLFAWMTAAWFSVFPHTDVAYFALSMANAILGICGIVALARRFLPAREAAVAGLAMAISPIYTTLAIKFNANTVLLSLWPWTAYFFVRYVQTGTRKAALAMGAMAGVAMLGKYFSVAVLAGLALAGLCRPAWRARLMQPQVLLAVMAGAIVLWPHMRWLIQNDMPTFTYARERMHEIARPVPLVMGDMVLYALVQIAYLLPGMAFVLLMVRHSRGRAAKLMFHGYVRRSLDRDLWWLSMGTFLAICALALFTRTHFSALWGNTQWFAITVFWLAMLANAGISLDPRRIAPVLAMYWVLTLALAAGGGYLQAIHHDRSAMEPRAELARAAHAVWRSRATQALAYVAGDDKEARSVAFYARTRIDYWDIFDPATTPWVKEADVRSKGVLFVCRADDRQCRDKAASFTGAAEIPVSVSKTVWGVHSSVRDYALFVLPPAE